MALQSTDTGSHSGEDTGSNGSDEGVGEREDRFMATLR
jgi:hypothetical protein